MKDYFLRFIRWFEPLFTEDNVMTHKREASKAAFAWWIIFGVAVWAIRRCLRHTESLPHAELVFQTIEVLVIFIGGIMFGHKVLLPKSKYNIPGMNGDGNGGSNGSTNGDGKNDSQV